MNLDKKGHHVNEITVFILRLVSNFISVLPSCPMDEPLRWSIRVPMTINALHSIVFPLACFLSCKGPSFPTNLV
jgi:hypothetical protein